MIDDNIVEIRKKLRDDFEYYAPRCLKIRPKSGSIVSFKLNSAQKFIHDQIEKQKKEHGYVRAIILKGRQQGCSTYTEGRYYWLVSQSWGKQAFILTHQQAATDNLFGMVQRYHDNCPEILKPKTSSASSKELYFEILDSGYKVGTAGSKGVGRSSTIQLFHGSEVAFWPHAAEHASGVMNAIPSGNGTEIILESTANGVGNYFHDQWQSAVREESQFIPIFVPWHWQDEYTLSPRGEFELTAEERELKSKYSLSDGQINWRRHKISEFEGVGGEILFKQEYPFTPEEAFQVSSAESFIPASIVLKAAENQNIEDLPGRSVVIGVDPARFGNDSTGIIVRQGLRVIEDIRLSQQSTMAVVGYVINLIQKYNPSAVFIDEGGLGAGIIDRLEEMRYNVCLGVNFGSSPEDTRKYFNKRAEMWGKMREWLKRPVCLPKNQNLLSEIMIPHFSFASNGSLKLEPKDSIKKRGYKSPDLADALALTFAFDVSESANTSYGGGIMYNRVNQGEI